VAKQNGTATAANQNGLEIGDVSAQGEYQLAATFNGTFPEPGAGNGLPDLAEPGETIRGKPVLEIGTSNTPGNVRWQIDAGVQQDTSDGIITYTFATWNHGVGVSNSPWFYQGQGYTPFTDAQKAAARVAITNWDDLISAKFVEIPAGPGASVYGKNTADIVMANTYTGPAQAEAYYPGLVPYFGPKYQRVEGDVWIADPRINSSNLQLDPGFYGLQTLNHELGHSLGLSHPGNYNFGDDQDGDGVPDPITYEADAFYFQDSHQYTIMSYFDSYETGNDQIDWNLMRFVYPSTPMVHDIAIMQQKYGADMTTRTGDTTYGFNATADVTNPAMAFKPGEMLTMFSIWDAGGNDTLDLSGYNSNSVIDLRPGAYTSAGGPGVELTLAQINANNAAAGLGSRTAAYDLYFGGRPGSNEGIPWSELVDTDFVMDNNIGIAYGAIIENAIGGGGNDQLNGNSANNQLTGGAGSDTFIFVDDGSVDTIKDYKAGVDKIDLTEIAGVNASDVSFNAAQDKLFVNTDDDAAYEMTIIVKGDDVLVSDILFGAA
jgi:Ca2+-binding RTX toxin-like protein